ncbi:unnamed protein product [Dibothriocephalus latus]|uniref:G-protein coupled receptors family 1 profile domain-containing protein n=1 Tax=Dibothriocephalus latus TaxID=60516 RepID=A0A3P7LGC1_DIBLA|nr:unnamed protein product [Dibothriocephalus latus]
MSSEEHLVTASEGCEPPPFSSAACVAIILVFSIISVMTILGNGIVIWIVLTTRRMRTVTNYFLVNLSVSDMLTVFQIIPNIYNVLLNDWIFGLAYCKFSQFFTAFSIAISVLTFTGLTADRYVAIKYPLRPRSRPSTILCVIAFIWVSAFIIGLPGLLKATTIIRWNDTAYTSNKSLPFNETTYATTEQIFQPRFSTEYNEGQEHNYSISEKAMKISSDAPSGGYCHVCTYDWSPFWGTAYDIALFLLMYILPLLILFATYIPITIKLWAHRGLGEVTHGQRENVKSKRKVVKMLIAVMLIFAICWLPYQLFFLILRAPIDHEHPSLPSIFIFCYVLAMSNSMYNPIIYCTMNRRFKNGFLNAIGCLPCVKRYQLNTQRSRLRQTYQSALPSPGFTIAISFLSKDLWVPLTYKQENIIDRIIVYIPDQHPKAPSFCNTEPGEITSKQSGQYERKEI